MLLLGILYQIRTLLGGGSERDGAKLRRLVHAPGNVPVAWMLVVMVLLLIVSLLAA